ncbi:penicillin-binding protein 1C [Deltaproteobacteria bacterium Smac51]|nr:penicillin-binding protein 1C [Deltaproteobacteria bacterium Smac51]
MVYIGTIKEAPKGPAMKKYIKFLKYPIILLILFLGFSWLVIEEPAAEDFAVSPTLLDKNGRLFHARLSADGEWLLPAPLSSMGDWLPKVAVAIEDRRFYSHHGVDFLALARASWQNLSNLRIVSGASTIPVQVVRLSHPRPRTMGSKYVEFVQALKLSRHTDKNRLMELYLNRAPFGGNLRGAEAAARFYFDKRAEDLSLGESATLVALLRGPSIYRPDRNPELARQKRDGILDLLVVRGVATEEEAAAAKAEPISGQPGRMPREAWHFSELVLAGSGEAGQWRWGGPGREYGLKTTLDRRLQVLLENRMSMGLRAFPSRVTGAGAIMDNNSGAVLAYVGNARWTENYRYWVDCAQALRSPGSTLKPFIYLAAFSNRGLTPASLVADTPLQLSGQAPRNFDRYYRGPVNLRTALAESLNAPAVRVLREVGQRPAIEILRQAGFENIGLDSRHYGDSLILGGCEVTLMQLLRAYGALARQGSFIEPRLLAANSAPETRRIFSEGSSWLVNESLKDDSRLPTTLRLNRENNDSGEAAFKTGTSHGLRDAWLAAYTPDHTVVLWNGDPDGYSHPELTALKTLGPVMVPLMRDVESQAIVWPEAPLSVETYMACPVSGQPAGPHCPGRQTAHRLRAGAKSHPCRLHTIKDGQTVTLWPPELAGFMATAEAAPAAITFGYGPIVTSPLNGGAIIVEGSGEKIPLRCEGARGRVHWFVNDEFYTSANADMTPVMNLEPGEHQVALVDSLGRTASSKFSVLYSIEQDGDRHLPVLSF